MPVAEMTETPVSFDRRFTSASELDRWYSEAVDGLAKLLSTAVSRQQSPDVQDEIRQYAGGLLVRLAVARERGYELLEGRGPLSPPVGIGALLHRVDYGSFTSCR